MKTEYDFIVGVNPILEQLKSRPGEISEILICRSHFTPRLRAVERQAQERHIKLTYVTTSEIEQLTQGQRHQGVVARVPPYAYWTLPDLEKNLVSGSGPQWILMLDGLNDPRNFGAILRTAEAVGVRHVVIPKDRSVGITPVVIKASAGAIARLQIYRVTNLRRAIVSLKNKGFWIAGLDAAAPEVYCRRIYPEKLGIVLGSEGHGIRPLIAQSCDYLVQIPMRGSMASLNVSVAGAVFLYELLRQQGSIDKNSPNGY
jgi:23S rRNA (guanosine2251-2'-O)-methyltransferase